jgi:hypothetical protein
MNRSAAYERLVYVDSTNRDKTLFPNGSSYTLHLTDVVKNVSRVDLVAAKVPNTLFNVTNGSNVLTYTGISGLSNIFLDTGFYSAYGIQSELTNSSNALVAYQYLPDEGKYLLFAADPFTVTFHTSEIAKLTGFNAHQTYSSFPASSDPVYQNNPNYASYNILKSPNGVDFVVNEYVFLDIAELRTPTMIDAKPMDSRTGTYSGSNARRSFAMIQMDVSSGCIKNFKESQDYHVSVFYPEPINSLDRLTIGWYDKLGNLLNFEGFDNNAFVLRFYLDNGRPELPPPPAVPEVEIKRIIDAMTALPPKPEPKKKPALGRWFLYIFIVILALWGIHWYRRYSELSAAQAVPQPLPHTLKPVAPQGFRQ